MAEKKTMTQAEAAKKRPPAKAATQKAAAPKRVTAAKRATKSTKPAKINRHPLMATDRDWDREAVMDVVLDRIATSSKSLVTILKEGFEHQGQHYELPAYSTVMKWIDDGERQEGKPSFSDSYARARASQAHVMHDDILEIHKRALQPLLNDDGEPVVVNGEPVLVATQVSVQLAKLEADNKKWLMSKMLPKKYGDRVDHVSTDGSMSPKEPAALDLSRLSSAALEEIVRLGDESAED